MNSPLRRRTPREGFVLIITLGLLAIMTLLLLALLRGSSHQIRGAQGDASIAREKMLADSAVALVIGQIQQASTQTGQAWISQPGLLRTYAAETPRVPTACYKLYSAASLVDTSGTLNFLATDLPADWNSTANQNLYTDLNAPEQTTGSPGQLVYPILDQAALATVQGLSSSSTDTDTVEMPVMWLYQLQDGTLGPASNGTKTNPIVGRIAFWTDDETSKIDINTAGAGDAWNTPHVNSADDVAWSTTQPAHGEFSRYPGHPAMTSLSPVFGQGATPLSPQQMLVLSPRYAWGGSEMGAQNTTFGESVTPALGRLYASLDELCFGTTISSGQRQANTVTPAQVEQARFVLTAHSESPETTLLGEPRIAIWPVADAAADTTKTTATDRAIESAATVGARAYFFQRHNALSATADLDTTTTWGASNMQLFNDLVARGGWSLPGYGTSFSTKYAGATWPQLMLEILDFMRGLNAIDPAAPPFVPNAPAATPGSSAFVPFAVGNTTTGVGRGFIIPLTATDPATGSPLRGLGRCPVLSGLTLVFYVSGFGFADGSTIDFDGANPAPPSDWQTYFAQSSSGNHWSQVTSELIRAFVLPCTFHPGCAYPEVSDACDIQITGLNALGVASATSNEFGFPSAANSSLLGTPLQVLSADRAWGGNEGPIAWRATGDLLASGASATFPAYPFAGSNALNLKLPSGSTLTYNSTTKTVAWPSVMPTFTLQGATLMVLLRDSSGNPLQTYSLAIPTGTLPAPTIQNECDHCDGATPATSNANWATAPANQVLPCYYMNLQNRLLATQLSRALCIQPGDVTRGMEAKNDLRVIAGLSTVPAALFQTTSGTSALYTSQAIPQIHNLRFADGTSAYGAYGSGAYGTYAAGSNAPSAGTPNGLVLKAVYPATMAATTGTDWSTGNSGVALPNAWFTTPACNSPTTSTYVTMMPTQNVNGDWDTGPGFCPDGALINLPDQGTSLAPATAYFSLAGGQFGAGTRFSPNALVPSPVIFGSLPAGINPLSPAQSEPWRGLLFCPYPAADTSHPGFVSPPDHLVLDNFWMPTVEPYAISTCMTTAGKINLNDQIVPFTYLHRNTAFYSLLGGLRIPAIPVVRATPYKTSGTASALNSIWMPMDNSSIAATIAAIESRFAAGSVDAYLSESEICTVPLVPSGQTAAGLDTFWNGSAGAGRLTGMNLRELPYAQLYGRLTTRSNSYTVHVRVQVLQKLPGDPQQNVWKEGTDVILGDWRGSYEIERYLDPAATAPVAGNPLGPYHFCIVSSRRFAP